MRAWSAPPTCSGSRDRRGARADLAPRRAGPPGRARAQTPFLARPSSPRLGAAHWPPPPQGPPRAVGAAGRARACARGGGGRGSRPCSRDPGSGLGNPPTEGAVWSRRSGCPSVGLTLGACSNVFLALHFSTRWFPCPRPWWWC